MVAAALAEGGDNGLAGHDERLVARVCIALDPAAPVRYKGFAAAVDGFGPALVAAFRGRGSVQQIAEAMGGGCRNSGSRPSPASSPSTCPSSRAFERLRLHLEDRRPGFGIERIAYELNPMLHCLSPAIETDYVIDAGDVLAALERARSRRAGDDFSVDRHIAAFISARYRQAGQDWFDRLDSSDPAQRVLGRALSADAAAKPEGPPAVPALAKRLAPAGAGGRSTAITTASAARGSRPDCPRSVAKGNLARALGLRRQFRGSSARDMQGFRAGAARISR